jgi:energy-converting hydrogenase A subunit A
LCPHIDGVFILISYILTIISAIILGLFLKLPLLPDKPMRNSWKISIIFPTIIIAIGLYAILDYFKVYNTLYAGIIIGIFSAVFSRFFLERAFPKPDGGSHFE